MSDDGLRTSLFGQVVELVLTGLSLLAHLVGRSTLYFRDTNNSVDQNVFFRRFR